MCLRLSASFNEWLVIFGNAHILGEVEAMTPRPGHEKQVGLQSTVPAEVRDWNHHPRPSSKDLQASKCAW
jgi:hypothetical protein